jgi:hypothetical protein
MISDSCQSSDGVVCLTVRRAAGKATGPTPEYQCVQAVIYRCSFHGESDGSDRRFCCQSHVSASQEQTFSLATHTLAPDCETCSDRTIHR